MRKLKDSKDGSNGWGINFINYIRGIKKELPDINNEIQNFIDLLNSDIENVKMWSTDELINYAKSCNITDKSFLKFLNSVDTSGDIMGQYKAHLVKLQKEQSTFTSFTQKASTALKSLGAAMASMAINWAIGKVIDLAVTRIDNNIHSVEHCKGRVYGLMSSYQSVLDKANSFAKIKATEQISYFVYGIC